MANEAYQTVKECDSCCRMRVNIRTHNKYLKLFLAERALDFVTIDLWGSLRKTEAGNQDIIVVVES